MNHKFIIAQRVEEIPLSLYIHFPWCLTKCPYCDFNSYPIKDKKKIAYYIDKLLLDLQISSSGCRQHKLHTIYFGGGTPSLMTPQQVSSIIDQAKQYFSLSSHVEITLECNPGTINTEIIHGLQDAGINRYSIGIQSFNDNTLAKIKRIHTAQEAKEVIQGLLLSGIVNYNLDLMFGLPNQSVKDALFDLDMAISFNPPHLSWYQYTVKPNAELPSEEELWQIQQKGEELLVKNGYTQYEIAAFARLPKLRSQHNMNYWQFGDYLGIGAGAHSKLTFQDYQVKRYVKLSDPAKYMASADLIENHEMVAPEKLPLEFMLNALRLYQPIPFALFEERTGQNMNVLTAQLQTAQNLGLIKLHHRSLLATKKGRNFLDNLLEIFL